MEEIKASSGIEQEPEKALQRLIISSKRAPAWAILFAVGEEHERLSLLDPVSRQYRIRRATCLYAMALRTFPQNLMNTGWADIFSHAYDMIQSAYTQTGVHILFQLSLGIFVGNHTSNIVAKNVRLYRTLKFRAQTHC
jgi:hypothetical protein